MPTLVAQQQKHSSTIEDDVSSMLGKLTLEQKIDLIGGVDNMFIRAEPSINFPRLKMSDGPMGVRTWGKDTAYAAGIGLAASWDVDLAKRVGVGLGQDARARGVHFLLGPGVNIYRAPMNGRNFEYFGEDPYLAGQIAAGYIQGVQSQHVIATVKHYDANNSEYDRHDIDETIDERALREIYLPAFEAAVKEGDVGSVMDSYNLINGEHATQNGFLNNQVLKNEWGFRGILMSDWDATYDSVAAANGGLDLEMPSGKFMNRQALLPAIRSGKVSEATIDDKVRRILRTAMEFGFLKNDQTDLNVPLFNQQGRETTLEAAEESAVLLKNEGDILPLDRDHVRTIAVIGPDSDPAIPTAGGSGEVTPFTDVSFLTGISDAAAPGIKVYWNSGVKELRAIFAGGTQTSGGRPASAFFIDRAGKERGIRQEQFANPNFKGKPSLSSTIQHIDFLTSYRGGPASRNKIGVRWIGYYIPREDGKQRFVIAAVGRDAYRVYIDNKLALEQTSREGQVPQYYDTDGYAGKAIAFRVDYRPNGEHVSAGFGVVPVSEILDPDVAKIAGMADVVILSVGFNPMLEGEGHDRAYGLPMGQDELIQTVLDANPRTIVVLTAGGSVDTSRWIDRTPVLIHTWYAGQEGGRALAKLLFGDVSPSGKLPISFEKRLADNPCYNIYYEAAGSHHVKYSEGIFVGYRYYDSSTTKPLFPFGFGLSYTTFTLSHLQVSPASVRPDDPISVSFDVKNSGHRAGAEVAQVYVGDPSATVRRPEKELKAFGRVFLKPGETQRLTMTLNRRSLAYWDVGSRNWKVDPGKFVIYVGDSSINLPLQKELTVAE